MTQAVLTLNAGSSSIKFKVFKVGASDRLELLSRGEVEAIGSSPRFLARDAAGKIVAEQTWTNPDQPFESLMGAVIGCAEEHLGADTLAAVGHRVVHGGPDHDRPEMVTPELLDALDRLTLLAPLHQPHNLAPIRAINVARPDLPQVACFDTAFHHGMPLVATRFALPREFEATGIRRYGFHGLSYEYIAERLRHEAPALSAGRVIVAHLGNGASLCAMRDGRSIDTTMGFTALDGLMMGTRCGDLDPGVVLYLQEQRGLSVGEVGDLLNKRSGLLGVSGISGDMRALLTNPAVGAREAIELFVFRLAREIGALTSSLGGLGGLVFTAGIGEHAPEIRAMTADRLDWLGVKIDNGANARNSGLISRPDSRIEVRVMPTDEEAMIARHTVDLVASSTAAS